MPADAAAVQQKTSRSPASGRKRWPLRSAAEGLPSSGGKAAYENTAGERKYCILYGGNSSKRWDGKKIIARLSNRYIMLRIWYWEKTSLFHGRGRVAALKIGKELLLIQLQVLLYTIFKV